jgi:type II secretory pathway pseudopilin PulG
MNCRCPKIDQCAAERAATLIEVVIGMGVLGIVLTSIFASFTFGFNVVKISRDELRATQILHEQMERLRLYNWDQIANQSNFMKADFTAPLGFTGPVYYAGKILITNAQIYIVASNSVVPMTEPYSKNLKEIVVTLTWTNNNLTRTRQARTFISKYGLQNYVP